MTERDIEAAVRAGARTLDCLEHQLAVSTCCGQCRCFATDVLRQALGVVARSSVGTELERSLAS